ncbi:MAG: CHASE2 domain-containing protein, partial [Beijerinckiaceae bacterium]|nr:CHASE2 domain-containing protein [Beijerinckiaceae bacterium]
MTGRKDKAPIGALRLPPLKQIILGGLVASLALLGQTDILSNISGAFNDKDVMARWSSVLSGATRQAIPLTIVDIDDATIARVGGGDRTPRDLVAALASLAAAKNAAAIVLDLDTSKPGPDVAGDKALIEAVASWPTDAPPLMYARR